MVGRYGKGERLATRGLKEVACSLRGNTERVMTWHYQR